MSDVTRYALNNDNQFIRDDVRAQILERFPNATFTSDDNGLEGARRWWKEHGEEVLVEMYGEGAKHG